MGRKIAEERHRCRRKTHVPRKGRERTCSALVLKYAAGLIPENNNISNADAKNGVVEASHP